VSFPKLNRQDNKLLSGDIWAPFAGIESDSESESELELAFGSEERQHYQTSAWEEHISDDTLREEWNARVVKCIKHMTSDLLNDCMTTGMYPLSVAIQYATSATISLMGEKGTDINAINTNPPSTALDIAAQYGCEPAIAALLISKLRRPVDDFTGSSKRNPLQQCCAHSDSNLVLLNQLLVAGPDPILPDRDGITPLMIAASEGAIGPLKVLLKRNVPLDSQKYGSGPTALHFAAAKGSSDCIRALLKAGADPSVQNEEEGNYTPLHCSAINRYWDAAEILIQHMATASILGVTGGTSIIHEAAEAGEERVWRTILELPVRVDLNTKNKNRLTPLELAATNEDITCFKMLLDNGASLDTGMELTGGIELAAMSPTSNGVRNILLNQNMNWKKTRLLHVDNHSFSREFMNVQPLHFAACLGNDSSIHFLQDNDLVDNIDVAAEINMTALHFAAYNTNNHGSTVKLLLELGANIEATEARYQRTPLMCAARCGNDGALKVLLERGCDTSAVDSQGFTAHMVALNQGHKSTAQILKMHSRNVEGVSDSKSFVPRGPGLSTASQLQASPMTQPLPTNYRDILERLLGEIALETISQPLEFGPQTSHLDEVQPQTAAIVNEETAAGLKMTAQEVIVKKDVWMQVWKLINGQNVVVTFSIGLAIFVA